MVGRGVRVEMKSWRIAFSDATLVNGLSVHKVMLVEIISHENSGISLWRKGLESRPFQTETIRRLRVVGVVHL